MLAKMFWISLAPKIRYLRSGSVVAIHFLGCTAISAFLYLSLPLTKSGKVAERMDNLADLVKELDIKARQLALTYNRLKHDHNKLQQKYLETEQHNSQLKQTILELEKQIQILTIAKSIPTDKDKEQGKKKINELLRELDTCIDLLNNKTI